MLTKFPWQQTCQRQREQSHTTLYGGHRAEGASKAKAAEVVCGVLCDAGAQRGASPTQDMGRSGLRLHLSEMASIEKIVYC